MSANEVAPVLPPGRFFTPAEFACHDGEAYPLVWADRWAELVGLCDAIREAWGEPLMIVSGYRSPIYNAQLMSADAAHGVHQVASGSQHTYGRAADLRPVAVTADRVTALHVKILDLYQAGKLPALGGLGIYETSGWCHVDTARADDGHLRRWVGR